MVHALTRSSNNFAGDFLFSYTFARAGLKVKISLNILN